MGLLHGNELISPLWQGKAILWVSALQMEKWGVAELVQKITKICEDLLYSSISNLTLPFLRLSSMVMIIPYVFAELSGSSAVPVLQKLSTDS